VLYFPMKGEDKLKTVQNKIGAVQDHVKENMEMTIRRQEDIEGISSKSASLQASASQFSQVATRIKQDQMLQIYRFYAMLVLGFICIGLVLTLWGSPGRLIIGLLIVAGVAALALFYFKKRREDSVAMADSLEASATSRDVEIGRE
jgi:hypothetical protein